MKLSIIIPYYNGEQWIAKCLDSLLHQDLASDDYEIFIVDDGSTHGIETLKAYIYPLWIMLCCCNQLLPICLRERIVKYIECKTNATKHNKYFKYDTLRQSCPFE